LRRAVIFNYDSIFAKDIENTISRYNLSHAGRGFTVNVCRAREYASESIAGPADVIIHSGGDGRVVREDTNGVPKFYICHSHEWKARNEGGSIIRLSGFIKGVHFIDILDDDEILGGKGRMPIMQYHALAVIRPPRSSKVLATSRAHNADGKEVEIIEALRYPDGSLSVQGHPEEGRAAHIIYKFFDRIKKKEEIYNDAS
jgi:GMP synthase-like glutamine amidotransferase